MPRASVARGTIVPRYGRHQLAGNGLQRARCGRGSVSSVSVTEGSWPAARVVLLWTMSPVRGALAISGFVAALLGCSGDAADAADTPEALPPAQSLCEGAEEIRIDCSGDDAEVLPPVQALCDGSDDVRFVFTSFRGFANFGSEFSGRYGSKYLVIDGRCHYWLGSEELSGLRTGTLDASASLALAEELHFGRYFAAADYRDPGGCVDAGLHALDDGTATLHASCFHYAPRILWEAYYRAYQLYDELYPSSTPTWDRTTLLALRMPEDLGHELPTMPRTPLDWTAPLDLEPRSVSGLELARGLGSDAGVLVEDAATLAVLASLRANVRDPNLDFLDILVRDARGRAYDLLLRDEPPDAVHNALEAVLAAP
jgi:hypothetical protein